MLCHICHIHAETALPLVNQQCSCLEYRLDIYILSIEIMESNIVLNQTIEVPVNMKELIYHVYVRGILCKGSILSDKFEQCFLSALLKQTSYLIYSKSFRSCTSLRGLPCCIILELRTDSSPVLLAQYRLAG